MSLPQVLITVADNGAGAPIQLPQQNVQVKIGVLISTALIAANVPFATSNPNIVQQNLIGGEFCESAGLTAAAGGTVICVGIPLVTKGVATAVVASVPGGSATVMTVTLDATNGSWDNLFVRAKCVTGGTVGTNGIQIRLSFDAGRTYGPAISLGTATTLALPNTGVTLNFTVATMVAGDYWSFSTTAPAGNDAGVQAALNALAVSQFGIAGWGSLHVTGVAAAGNVTNYQTYAESLATSKFVFTRVLTEARDALAPTAWGGSGETEATWVSSLATAFSATSAKRVGVSAGHYNMSSAFPNAYAGTPRYRRPLSWAIAVRRTQIPPQRKGGFVAQGALSSIVVDPANDPGDGFIYHDEHNVAGLDAARFMTALTWPKKPGFYVTHENLMAPNGSQFRELVYGNVIDIACDIGYARGVDEISGDLRLTDAGTLDPIDATILQQDISNDLKADMTDEGMVSAAFAVVDLNQNVFLTDTIKIDVSVRPKGYANIISETIALVP